MQTGSLILQFISELASAKAEHRDFGVSLRATDEYFAL